MRLFRPEALRGQDTLHGEVSLVPPVSWQALGLFLFGSVAVGVAFVATAGYAKVTVVKGVVVGDKGVLRIVETRGGVVDQVYVREGQTVRAGDPLAHISVATATDDGALEVRRAAALGVQRAELAQRLQAVQQGGGEQLAALRRQQAGDRVQIESLQGQIAEERVLLRRAEADLEKIRPAARAGFVNDAVVHEREDRVSASRQRLARLGQEAAARATAIQVAEADAARAQAETARAATQIAEERAALERAAAGEDLQSALVLRAPVDGAVTAVTVHAGDPAVPGATAMTLVPKGTRLEAELSVPPSAAGLLERKQPVRISVDAFPYQVYGALDGEVTAISRAAAPLPGAAGDAFLVRTTIPASVRAYGAARPLLPGMTVSARIRTRPRTLLAWIFDPVLAVRQR